MHFVGDFLFNDLTKEWFWLPLVGSIMGQIVSETYKRFVGPPDEQSSTVYFHFSEDRLPPRGSSQSGDAFAILFLISLVFYFANRPVYLAIFTFEIEYERNK